MSLKVILFVLACISVCYGGGAKIFLSLELTGIPWADSLNDHYSDGFRKLTWRINNALKTYSVVKDDITTKVIQLSEADEAILAKIIVKIADSKMSGIAQNIFLESLKFDVDNTGILGGDCLDVKKGSLIIHDIEKDKCCGPQKHDGGEYTPYEKNNHEYTPYTPYTPYEKDVKGICKGISLLGFVQIINEPWKTEYEDKSSDEYKDLVKRIKNAFDTGFENAENFAGIKIIAIREVQQPAVDKILVKFFLNSYVFKKKDCFDVAMVSNLHYEGLKLLKAGKIGDLDIDILSTIPTDICRVFFKVDKVKKQFKDSCHDAHDDYGEKHDSYTPY